MLLKAMGIDPVAIKDMMEKTIGNIQFIADSLKEIRASQERIEARLDALEVDRTNAIFGENVAALGEAIEYTPSEAAE